jgi:hypothetical protein
MRYFNPTALTLLRRSSGTVVITSDVDATGYRLEARRSVQIFVGRTRMANKILLVVPEAPAPAGEAVVNERAIDKRGIRLGVLDNSKGNADHLLKFIVDAVKAAVPVASVVSLRKASVSLPAPKDILDRLAGEADVVVSAMAD